MTKAYPSLHNPFGGRIDSAPCRSQKRRNIELIAGERRLRALRSLGSEKALCIVDNSAVDADSALMAVVENLQREDLNYFEEAECYKALLDELKLTQEELASRLGKSQSFIANKLRILKLSPEVREAVGLYG